MKSQDVMEGQGDISRTDGIWTHDFVLVFLAFFFLQAAYFSLIPAIPIYFARMGSGQREVGVLIGTMGGAALVARLFVGAILTKYSEKRVMLFGATLFALGLLAFIVFRPFWPLFVVMAAQGISFASMHTAAFAYAVKAIPIARRGQGLAYFTLATYLAMASAAPLGLIIVNRHGFTAFFLVFAVLCAFSFCLAWGAKEGKVIGTPDQSTQPRRTVFVERKVVAPAFAAFLQMFVYGALTAFFPLYAVQCGVTNPGLFFTASAVVVVMSRACGGRILDTYNKEKMILALILIMMTAMILLPFSKNLPMFILVGLLFGTGLAFFMPASLAYALEYAGSSDGPAVATFNASYDLGVALGPAVMGLFVPLTGYPGMFLTLALISFINLGYFQFYVRKRHAIK